jgi:hypothetical protein
MVRLLGVGFGGRAGGLVVGGGKFSRGDGFDFAADYVGGKAGAEQAAVKRSEFFVVNFAAEGAEFALDALADEGRFIVLLSVFREGRFDVLIGNATSAEFAGDAEAALAADFGALASELAGVAGIVNETLALEALHDLFDELLVVGAMGQGLLHFVNGMRAAGKDAGGGGVELRFGDKLVGPGEHEEKMS